MYVHRCVCFVVLKGMLNKLVEWQFLIDDKIEKEGFLDRDVRTRVFFMYIVN